MTCALQITSSPEETNSFRTFLRPSFTALANELIDFLVTTCSSLAEIKVLLLVSRYSTGFLRPTCHFGESKFLNTAGLSRSAFYDAKQNLISRGLLLVSHTKTGRCVYELAPAFQALLTGQGATPANPVQSTGPLPVRHSGPMKDNKENLNQYKEQHHQLAGPVTQNDDDFFQSVSEDESAREPLSTDDVSPLLTNEKNQAPSASQAKAETEAPVPTASMARKLQEAGVNSFVARRLAKKHPPEVIQAALNRLTTLTVENPAAYLVAEISRGGYGESRPDPQTRIRQFHQAVEEKREQQRIREEQEQSRLHQQKVKTPLELFAALPPEQQAALMQATQLQAEREGFVRLPGWGPEHPVFRGLLAERVLHSLGLQENSA